MVNAKDTGEVLIPQDKVDAYLGLRSQGIAKSKIYYFRHLMPLLHKPLEMRAEHQEIRKMGFHTLVSLMGFSPETTVQVCTVIRPKALVVICTNDEKSKQASEPAFDYLRRKKLISYGSLTLVTVDAFNPQNIYDQLRPHVLNNDSIVLDITGGTKVMSATAGALAWELNLPLCYLDGGWNPESGSAGLKKVSRLEIKPNPSRSRGYRFRQEAMDAYDRGNFVVAEERFANSRQLIDDSFFDQLGLCLCRCYGALVDFDKQKLQAAVQQLREALHIGGVKRLLGSAQDEMEAHLQALRDFADGDLFTRTAAFAELAEIYAQQGRHDFSGLLWYRAMEALVEWRFHTLEPRFKMGKPDWKLLVAHLPGKSKTLKALQTAYAKLSTGIHAPLPPRVTLHSGFSLLCVLSAAGEHTAPTKASEALMTQAGIRNQSYLAHGSGNLSEDQARKLNKGAMKLANDLLGENFASFEMKRQHLRPLDLGNLLKG